MELEYGHITTSTNLPTGETHVDHTVYAKGNPVRNKQTILRSIKTDNQEIVKHIIDALKLITSHTSRDVTLNIISSKDYQIERMEIEHTVHYENMK